MERYTEEEKREALDRLEKDRELAIWWDSVKDLPPLKRFEATESYFSPYRTTDNLEEQVKIARKEALISRIEAILAQEEYDRTITELNRKRLRYRTSFNIPMGEA